MSEWKEYRLGALGHFFGGVTSVKKEDYGHGFPFLQYMNIYKNWKVDVNNLELMNVKKSDLKKRNCIYGDIFFTASSEVEDEVAMSSVLLDDVPNLTFNGFCKRYRLHDFKTLLPEFARYLFRDKKFRGEVYQRVTGDVRFNISQKSLSEIPVLLPPLPEQRAIASVLSSLDDKIELLHRQNKTLEAMAETLYESWIYEKEFDSTIKDLIDIQNGYAFKSKDFQGSGHHRVLKIKNISGSIVDVQTTDYVPGDIILKIDKRFKIQAGDILFAMTGAKIGKMGIIPQNKYSLWLNQRVGLLKEKYTGSRFLAYLHLKSDFGVDYIGNTATGSAQPNISGVGIENCEFPKFSGRQIKEYSGQLNVLFSKVIFNLGQIHLLENIRDTLLPKLISREVRVNF